MPIAKLFVEGDLEIQSLNPILLGNPVLQQGGSKNALKARAGTERRENLVTAGYLRDRDFDFDPPADLTKPTLDSNFGGTTDPLGWRWCRHEIENYLIDPAIVGEATGWAINDFKDAIRDAATRIRDYEVSRWAIGIARRALPPHHELETRPEAFKSKDFRLPNDLSPMAVSKWALERIAAHRAPMVAATEPASVQKTIDDLAAKFDAPFLADESNVLIWFSGKDLLAALSDWLVAKGVANPGAFRALLRDWIIANSTRALQLLPEWDGLVQAVRA
jgi:hypothetical protein